MTLVRFDVAAHPRNAAGRFATASQGRPEVRLAAGATLQRLTNAAAEVLATYGNEIEVLNHGRRENGGQLLLQDMSDGMKAEGNCWIVTNELLERTDSGEFGVDEMSEIVIENRSGPGQHVALYVVRRGRGFVIDYTIRQFDQSLPFPFVATTDDWKATVEKATGFTFGWCNDDDDDNDDFDDFDDNDDHYDEDDDYYDDDFDDAYDDE
jgi:hypothetical protein